MENIKIAIIDSGIDTKNKYLMQYVEEGKSFILNDSLDEIIEGNDIQDNHGHGTSCAYTILRRNENVELTPIKVLDKLGRTSSKCLLKALEFLIDTDIKLINISLSTVNFDYEDQFFNLCNKLISKNKIIVASMDNRYRDSLPAILPNVIGVRGRNLGFTDEYWYNHKNTIQCICDNEPILVPNIKEEKMVFFGHNSKATAIMTANISKILSLNSKINYFELNNLLKKYSIKNNWTNEEVSDFNFNLNNYILENRTLKGELKENADLLCRLIIDTYKVDVDDINSLYKCSLFNNPINLNKHNIYNLIYAIEDKLNINLNYDKISLKTFRSIYSLLDLVIES